MNRILMCARGYPPDIAGGGEISTELIARGLRELGSDVQVLTLTDEDSRLDHIDGVPVHRVKCPNIYWSIQASEQPRWKKPLWHFSQALRWAPPKLIRQTVAKIDPTILHTSTIEDFGPGIWRWGKQQGRVTVHSLRSYNLLHHQSTLYDPTGDREIGLDSLSIPKRFYAKSLDGVIGISNCILDKHLANRFFQNSKTTVIGNPIADSIQNVAPPASPQVRLGILGRISPEKGIEPFLNCLKSVEQDPPWSLEIAGEGSDAYVAHLRKEAKDLPVQWVGWQASRQFLSGLDLLVVPSRWHEPFGRIVIEAYSIGLPVLCLDRGAMPELVVDGQTGWIADQWTPAFIGSAIKGCRNVKRDRIRSHAKKYTVTEIARQHQAFYRELTGSS